MIRVCPVTMLSCSSPICQTVTETEDSCEFNDLPFEKGKTEKDLLRDFMQYILDEEYYPADGVWWTAPFIEMAQSYTIQQVIDFFFEHKKLSR